MLGHTAQVMIFSACFTMKVLFPQDNIRQSRDDADDVVLAGKCMGAAPHSAVVFLLPGFWAALALRAS